MNNSDYSGNKQVSKSDIENQKEMYWNNWQWKLRYRPGNLYCVSSSVISTQYECKYARTYTSYLLAYLLNMSANTHVHQLSDGIST